MTSSRAIPLETVSLDVPDPALPAYEAALRSACATVGFFRDEAAGLWRLEGVKPVGEHDPALAAGLALAALLTGTELPVVRQPVAAEGWAERSYASFPEQRVGRRFALRGTHLHGPMAAGRITLTLDAGAAFGSGEHGSTRGCLRALERAARRRPRRLLDLGTGSGVLAMAATRLLHRPVLAVDIDPWAVRVAARNARQNRVGPWLRCRRADGWHSPVVRAGAPYDLVLANILARPLCRMARDLAQRLAPGGTVILAGLLATQARSVLAAHRRAGLVLAERLTEGPWTTLVLRAPIRNPPALRTGPIPG
ncbi:MAG: 50S ribosomal protein L11 methyltransferase [Rhodospirillales bacterium]|nr:50S ribosomal protein L11 methyltransferase [Rhodospirillales bacterium]